MWATAIIVGFLLHAAVLVPLVLACRPGRVGNAALALCPLLALGAVAWQFGIFGGPAAPQVSLGIQDEAGPTEESCRQVRDRLREVGLLQDDSNPQRVVVAGETWRQLPETVRNAVTECFDRLAPGEAPVEIVESRAN